MRVLALLLLTACVVPQTPTPAHPVALHVARSAPEVAQIAAQHLTLAGFTLTQSDVSAGLITAHRVRERDGNSAFAVCKMPPSTMQTDMTVSVAATHDTTGSDVHITTLVHTTYPGMPMLQASDEDCASNGVIEQQIAAAIR